MNENKTREMIIDRLDKILFEMVSQRDDVAHLYPEDRMSFDEEMNQLNEFVHDANEFVLAYESIVASLESIPFKLSGSRSVDLLEIGLLLRFKTEREEDAVFDFRG